MNGSARPTKALVRREVKRCANGLAGFLYWAAEYCQIEDKETHKPVPFNLWVSQREVIEKIFNGDWLWILKARRVGFTWLLAAYALWLVTFHAQRTIIVLNQDDDYAKDFLDKCRFILDRMPVWMRRTPTRDNTKRLEFNRDGHGSWIRAFAPTKGAARSLAADLVIIDEGAYVPYLQIILNATEPTLETSKGQLISLTTSEGPMGAWAKKFKRAWRGLAKFKALFYGWESHPGRDQAWYEAEAKLHDDDPLYMKRQYPRNPDEAFEAAEGRIYSLFSDSPKFVQRLAVAPEWKRYRGIDFGGTDPFVCLWVAIVPGDPDGFSVDPACIHTIEELGLYSYGEDGNPRDENNHCMDALRYLATAFSLRGHVHIYREFYLADSASRGLTTEDLGRRIAEFSRGEKIVRSVADRSRPDSINSLCTVGVPCLPSPTLRGRGKLSELEQGFGKVRVLIKGTTRTPEESEELAPPPRRPRQSLPLEGNRNAALRRRFGREGCAPAFRNLRPIFA